MGLVTFTEEIRNKKLRFFVQWLLSTDKFLLPDCLCLLGNSDNVFGVVVCCTVHGVDGFKIYLEFLVGAFLYAYAICLKVLKGHRGALGKNLEVYIRFGSCLNAINL